MKTAKNESLSIELINYNRAYGGYDVLNNGHSVQFNYKGDPTTVPTLTGTAVNNEKFILAQFHSHWGAHKGIGSEHTVDGNQYSLEVIIYYDLSQHYTCNLFTCSIFCRLILFITIQNMKA